MKQRMPAILSLILIGVFLLSLVGCGADIKAENEKLKAENANLKSGTDKLKLDIQKLKDELQKADRKSVV